ncbi:hypothetical protein RRG08_020767 [Elysia crispata]|uniref:Uncharacterized protein n=1 Tax=Elysia crispata TaxID=231223 RepID=A0AAE1B6W0_9GAST|nr:hypothetical protein RRG08_020767 [Elysia crispata]
MESYPDMSSESESEMSTNEARVYTTKTSPKRVAGSHRRTASQDKIRSLGKSASLDSTSQQLQQQQQQQQQHGSNSSLSNIGGPARQGGRKRRKRISEKPNISLNLWSFMKNAIGKELSKIPMPVGGLQCGKGWEGGGERGHEHQPEPVELHEERYRQGALQDTHAGRWPSVWKGLAKSGGRLGGRGGERVADHQPEPVELHEERYRQGALQDTHAALAATTNQADDTSNTLR